MKALIIVNPNSQRGSDTKRIREIRSRLAPVTECLVESKSREELKFHIRQAHSKGIDTLIAVGGDGTVNALVNEMAGSELSLGIIPSGTANDLAALYGIPQDISGACKVITESYVRDTDVISVNGWHYITAGGVGLASEVTRRANEIKAEDRWGWLVHRLLGSKIYLLTALLSMWKKSNLHYSLQVTNGKLWRECDSLCLMVDNQPFLGKHFRMTPQARNDDGKFDVCWIEGSPSRMETLSIILRILNGSHIKSPRVHHWQGEELLVRSERLLSFCGDGELQAPEKQFKIRLLPRALRVIVPRALLTHNTPALQQAA